MGLIIFKRLFEVRVLHEFHLAQNNETSFFALSEADRIQKLNDILIRGSYDIRRDLLIQPTGPCEELLKNYRMRFIPTASGFFVASEVNVSTGGGGQEVYAPAVPLSEGVEWSFGVQIKGPQFRNFTNGPFSSPLPLRYLFTNDNTEGNKVLPSLSLPVPVFEENVTYDMGELILLDEKLVQAQEQTGDALTGWKELTEDHRWASTSDRMLLPMRFGYTVSGAGVISAEFILKDSTGTEISRISSLDPDVKKQQTDSGDLLEVDLDFSTYLDTAEEVKDLADGFYQLEVLEAGGINNEWNLYLSDELYNGNSFGGIIIYSTGSDPASRVIDDDGFLVRTAAGTHPIFEVRLKNRITYWRYNSINQQKLEAKNKAVDFLEEPAAENYLVTKDPKSLQQNPLHFEGGGDKLFLPNPGNTGIRPEKDGRVYSDIFISEVEGLIENKN